MWLWKPQIVTNPDVSVLHSIQAAIHTAIQAMNKNKKALAMAVMATLPIAAAAAAVCYSAWTVTPGGL